MQHRPRKRFGQNFLQDPAIIHALMHAINPQKTDCMVEIGPGLGALTHPLLTKLEKLIAIEIDDALHHHLSALPEYTARLTVVHADALSVDFSQWGPGARIVGNLPYNISTPLLFHLLQHKTHIKDMHFMLQKEVVTRLTASPGCKAYGRLSILVQLQCDVEHLFSVPATAFYPAPKVESAVVRLTPHTTPRYPEVDRSVVSNLLSSAFAMRRKTLANNLKSQFSTATLLELGIEPSKRPEQISIEEYIRMAQFLSD